jgi:SAM-dependent methyltransferase
VDEEAILRHYGTGYERDRLSGGTSRIEFARTKELLQRFLPPSPATVLDVGGGPGAYATWLAGRGYRVHMVDAVPLHVEQAAERARGSFTVEVGDARRLEHEDSIFHAILLLGPLYHLTERVDRVRALAEAKRVVRPGGVVVAAAISRFASLFDGLATGSLETRRSMKSSSVIFARGSTATSRSGSNGSRRRTSITPMNFLAKSKMRASYSRPYWGSRDRDGSYGRPGTTQTAGSMSFARLVPLSRSRRCSA